MFTEFKSIGNTVEELTLPHIKSVEDAVQYLGDFPGLGNVINVSYRKTPDGGWRPERIVREGEGDDFVSVFPVAYEEA